MYESSPASLLRLFLTRVFVRAVRRLGIVASFHGTRRVGLHGKECEKTNMATVMRGGLLRQIRFLCVKKPDLRATIQTITSLRSSHEDPLVGVLTFLSLQMRNGLKKSGHTTSHDPVLKPVFGATTENRATSVHLIYIGATSEYPATFFRP